MKSRKRIAEFVLFLVAVLFSTSVFLFYSSKKSVWFCDEVYTLESANGVYKEWPGNLVNVWQHGTDMKEYFAATGESYYYSGISAALYDDHVPLYFWLYRTISYVFFKGQATFAPGLIINALFYFIAFTLSWVILQKATKSSLLPFAVCVLSFNLSSMFLAQETMIRMYMMLLADVVLLLACSYSILCNALKERYSFIPFLLLTMVSIVGLLTHFDYWIFYAITASLFCFTMLILEIKRKDKPFFKSTGFYSVLSWVLSFALSMGVTVKLFPYCIWNIRRDKGKTALDSLLVFSKDKLELIYRSMQEMVNNIVLFNFPAWLGFFGLAILWGISARILFVKKRINEFSCFLLSIVVSLGYVFVVAFTMPAGFETRYFWPAYSILLLLTIYGIYVILETVYAKTQNSQRVKSILVQTFAVVLVVVFAYAEIRQIDLGNGVPYLFNSEKNVDILESNSNKPWIVYGGLDAYSSFDFIMPTDFAVIDYSDQIGAADVTSELKSANSFVLYCSDGLLEEAIGFAGNVLEKELKVTSLTRSVNYGVYLVE